MHKYTATQQAENGPFNLIKDGRPAICPKTLAIMPQTNFGVTQLAPVQNPCNTSCPFATIESYNGNPTIDESARNKYRICCEGGKSVELYLEKLQAFEAPKTTLVKP
jgi:hypothetical protein